MAGLWSLQVVPTIADFPRQPTSSKLLPLFSEKERTNDRMPCHIFEMSVGRQKLSIFWNLAIFLPELNFFTNYLHYGRLTAIDLPALLKGFQISAIFTFRSSEDIW